MFVKKDNYPNFSMYIYTLNCLSVFLILVIGLLEIIDNKDKYHIFN